MAFPVEERYITSQKRHPKVNVPVFRTVGSFDDEESVY